MSEDEQDMISMVSVDLPTLRARALLHQLDRLLHYSGADAKGVRCSKVPDVVALRGTLAEQLAQPPTRPEGDAA